MADTMTWAWHGNAGALPIANAGYTTEEIENPENINVSLDANEAYTIADLTSVFNYPATDTLTFTTAHTSSATVAVSGSSVTYTPVTDFTGNDFFNVLATNGTKTTQFVVYLTYS
jgi:hypothetical protein